MSCVIRAAVPRLESEWKGGGAARERVVSPYRIAQASAASAPPHIRPEGVGTSSPSRMGWVCTGSALGVIGEAAQRGGAGQAWGWVAKRDRGDGAGLRHSAPHPLGAARPRATLSATPLRKAPGSQQS